MWFWPTLTMPVSFVLTHVVLGSCSRFSSETWPGGRGT